MRVNDHCNVHSLRQKSVLPPPTTNPEQVETTEDTSSQPQDIESLKRCHRGRDRDCLPPGIRKNVERGHIPPENNPFYKIATELLKETQEAAKKAEEEEKKEEEEHIEDKKAEEPVGSQLANLIINLIKTVIQERRGGAGGAQNPSISETQTLGQQIAALIAKFIQDKSSAQTESTSSEPVQTVEVEVAPVESTTGDSSGSNQQPEDSPAQ